MNKIPPPRQLIVLAAEQQDALSWAKKLVASFPEKRVLHQSSDIKRVLGKEYLAVLYNTYEGFDPDMLGAISGTIMAGGALILITPPLDQWQGYDDPFNNRIANWPYQGSDLSAHYISRFIAKLKQAECVQIISEAAALPVLCLPDVPKHSKTEDQVIAIDRMLKIIRSDQPAPVVLEADRGRGKSAVLGMLVAELADTHYRVLITAPTRKTANVVFRHADDSTNLHFIAPDQLCLETPPADILLVDEAAAIPTTLLVKMLKHYPQIIFSTTVHGYEGTGRGFALRFKQQLDAITPQWEKITLHQPIRYAEHDPLENFLFDSLLLNAKPVDSQQLTAFSVKQCIHEKITSNQLVQNEALLREIFGLLVLAHYQTRPTDLRHLLDGKNISIDVMKWQGHVVATSLCVQEGGMDNSLAHEIHYGKRRPRGHLVPQSLAVHAGIADAPVFITDRVMRIVVHPAVQRQGVASLLLKQIEKNSTADYLSSSFGATLGLLEFWNKQGFEAVRIGLSRDASSGCHSVIMMKTLTKQGDGLFTRAKDQFQRYFPVLLSEPLSDLEDGIVHVLQSKMQNKKKDQSINKQDREDIESFAYGNRGYENCMFALQKLVQMSMKNPLLWQQLMEQEQLLLEAKVIQQKSWLAVSKLTLLSGKKQTLNKLRDIIQHIVELS